MSWVLLTPDGLIGGRLDLVVERLAAGGFRVRATRLLALDLHKVGQLYTHVDEPPVFEDRRGFLPGSVIGALYRLAPACLLMLADPPGDPWPALLALKGIQHPDQAPEGTIRAAGEHAIFNFVHCPDDAPSAAVELAYLVGAEAAARLEAADDPLLGLEVARLALPAFSGPESISFPYVANRLRLRVLQHLAPHPALTTAHAALVAERAALAGATTAAGRLALARAASPPIHAALSAAADDPAIREGLAALADLYRLDGPRRLAPITALAERGVYLGELERVTIDAHRHASYAEATPLPE